MATQLPRYRRVGAQPVVSRGIDFAAAAETERLGQTISQQVEQMSRFAFEEQKREAVQRGEQAVQEMGAQPVLQQLRQAGGPSTIAEQAAYKSANEIARVEIETMGKTEISKILQAAEAKKLPLTEVQAQLADVVDGLPAALSDLDPSLAGITRANLAGSATLAGVRYAEYIGKHQAAEAQGRFLNSIAVRQQEINMVASSDAGPNQQDAMKYAEMLIRDLETSMRNIGFSEADVAKTIINTRVDAVKENLLSRFNRLPTLEAKQKFIDDFEKNPNKVLGVTGSRTMQRAMQADINSIRTELRARKTAADKVINGEISNIKDDIRDVETVLQKGNPSRETMQALAARIGRLPTSDPKVQDLNRDFQRLVKVQAYVAPYKGVGAAPAAIQERINQIRSSGLEAEGEQGVDTVVEARVLSTLEGMLSENKAELSKDPVSFAVRNKAIQFTPLNFSSEQALSASAAARIQDARKAQNTFGGPLKILTDTEATRFTEDLSTGTIGERMQLLGAINRHFKSQASVVIKQIAEKNPEIGLIGGLVSLGRLDTAKRALQGMDLMKQGVKAIGATPTMVDPTYAKTLRGSLMFQDKSFASGKDISMAIYTQMATERGLDAFNPRLYQEAVSLAFGYDKSTGKGGIQEVRDYPVIVPRNMNADELTEVIENLSNDKLVAAGFNIDKKTLDDIRTNDKFRLMNYRGDNYVLVYSNPSEPDAFRVVPDKNGKEIIINPQQMRVQ